MLSEHTNDAMMALLVDRSRRASTEGAVLADIHRAIGNLLAVDVARRLRIEECDIEHPTGRAKGIHILPGHQPVIVALLRAGLFVAEGVWERLPGSTLILQVSGHDALADVDLGGRPTIIVDAVINSGRSIAPVIQSVQDHGAGDVMVATLVGYRPTLLAMTESMPEVTFIAARVSERSYVGKGQTDTGDRLFGTR